MNDQEELVIVVNEQDEILSYLPRKEVHEKKLLHRTISIVTFTSDGKIVLQKRSKNKDTNPGMLGNAVGGHVLKGEEYLESARSEAKEELNIEIEPEFITKIVIEDPAHRTMTSIYKIVYDGPYDYNKEEIDGIIVMTKKDLKNNLDKLYESTKIVLRKVGVLK